MPDTVVSTGTKFSQSNWLVIIDNLRTHFDVARDKVNYYNLIKILRGYAIIFGFAYCIIFLNTFYFLPRNLIASSPVSIGY